MYSTVYHTIGHALTVCACTRGANADLVPFNTIPNSRCTLVQTNPNPNPNPNPIVWKFRPNSILFLHSGVHSGVNYMCVAGPMRILSTSTNPRASNITVLVSPSAMPISTQVHVD